MERRKALEANGKAADASLNSSPSEWPCFDKWECRPSLSARLIVNSRIEAHAAFNTCHLKEMRLKSGRLDSGIQKPSLLSQDITNEEAGGVFQP